MVLWAVVGYRCVAPLALLTFPESMCGPVMQAEVKAEEEERTFGFGSRPRLSRNRSK